jgi:carboxymethylenebutenolidase
MIERVEFAAVPSNHGKASGVLAAPVGSAVVPAIVVLQEFWGLNDHIQAVAERWAKAGFLALAPDLYRGGLTADRAVASKMMADLDRERALADIAGAVTALRSHPRCTGFIGVTGYCLGGAFAFAAAAAVEGLAAVVPFYGVPPGADWSKVSAPIQAHFSATDTWAKPELAKQIQQTLQAAGQSMELFVYDAPHAFCNDTRSEVYSPEAAALAWQRSVEFMRLHLGA